MDTTITAASIAVLVKLETTEGADSSPDPTVDAIPIEADSWTSNAPWTTEQSNEANGSYVAGAPLVIGQAATFSFKFRIKGAGAGVNYSPTVKPPHHQVYQACGWRGQYTSSVSAAALVSGGGGSSIQLANSFPNADLALVGMELQITAGVGAGAFPAVTGYVGATRTAALADRFNPPLDTTTTVKLPANWTYAQTSPADAAARATDMPSATVYAYRGGTLLKFVGCRGTMSLDGKSARPGYATVNFTGIYAGKVDAAMPANLVVAGHQAPVLVQGTGPSPAVMMNRKALPISTWSLEAGSQIEVPEDPNTPYGFSAGQIVDRTPVLKVDPTATLVGTRDTVTDIGNGQTMPAVFRHGSAQGNAWALIVPLAQPTGTDDGTRGKLLSENITLQCRNAGKDATGRDNDRGLFFY